MSAEPKPPSRLERFLAVATLAVVIVAVLSFIATLVVGMLGDRTVLVEGMWPFIVWLSYIGLPIAFAMLIALLIISMRRRGKESDAASREKRKK